MAINLRMLNMLRQRRDLEADDDSQDDKILKMSPVDIVTECTAWMLGDGSWANSIAGWMDSAGAKPEDF